MTDPFAAFETTAAPPRAAPFKRPPDPAYPDAGLRRLMARGVAPDSPPIVVAATSNEERAILTEVAVHLAAMGETAYRIERTSRTIARLELALADPSLTDQYPDDSDERDAGEERLCGLLRDLDDAHSLFASHACQVDHLLDQVPYAVAVEEVSGWPAADVVIALARGHPNVMARRWMRIAAGLAVKGEQVSGCPW